MSITTQKDAFILDQFDADDGSTFALVVTKNRRLAIRRHIDGRHVAVNLDEQSCERLGMSLAKYLNHMRGIAEAESLL